MSPSTYSELLHRIDELVHDAPAVTSQDVGAPANQIIGWIQQADACLRLLEDKLPTATSEFQRIRKILIFKVPSDELHEASSSAYTPVLFDPQTKQAVSSPFLMDFRFDLFPQVVKVLEEAAAKLKLELVIEDKPLSIGKRLRAARKSAGHSQFTAGEALGCDPKTISLWETEKAEPQVSRLPDIENYIKHAKQPKGLPKK